MYCKDCKHWEPPEHPETIGQCSHDKVGIQLYDGMPSDICAASDDMCSIMTGPDFGCIHFEAK